MRFYLLLENSAMWPTVDKCLTNLVDVLLLGLLLCRYGMVWYGTSHQTASRQRQDATILSRHLSNNPQIYARTLDNEPKIMIPRQLARIAVDELSTIRWKSFLMSKIHI